MDRGLDRMHALIRLLFTFSGRIGRATWWLGHLAVLSVSLAVLYFQTGFDLERINQLDQRPLADVAVSIVVLVPLLALTIKRLNDRDHPKWLGIAWAAGCIASIVAPLLGFDVDPKQFHTPEMAVALVVGLFTLWVMIDNGFLKGTPGPNRHGPDPVARPDAPAAAAAAPPANRRSIGAHIRNGVVAFFAIIFAWALLGPVLGLPSLGRWVFTTLFMPADLTMLTERLANKSALEADSAGDTASRADDPAGAIEHYSRAIALYGPDKPAAAESYRGRAWVLRRAGKLQESLGDYSKAMKLEPKHAVYAQRALTFRDMGRHGDALRDFDAALAKNPDSVDAHAGRGQVLEILKRPEEALAAYAAAIPAADRTFDRHWKLWEETSKDLSEDASWRSRLRRERDHSLALTHLYRGMMLGKLGRREDALKDYNEALRLRPEYRAVYVNRGWMHERGKEPALARADYEKAAAMGTPDEWLTRALGRTR